MGDVLTCEGTSVSGIWIPPFHLALGEMICLHLPGLVGAAEEGEIVAVLTGNRVQTGVRVHGRGILAKPPCFRRGLLAHLNHPTAAKWLLRMTGMALEQANAVVDRLGLRRGWRIGQVPWEGRVQLGLEAAWACQAKLLVFHTIGLSDSGCASVFSAVRLHLGHCAALHLGYAFNCQGKPGRICPEGATCIELARLSPPMPASKAS